MKTNKEIREEQARWIITFAGEGEYRTFVIGRKMEDGGVEIFKVIDASSPPEGRFTLLSLLD